MRGHQPIFPGGSPMKKALVLLLALVLAGSAASLVLAAYPDRPVKLIVPWAAGGDTDNIFRPFTPAFQKALGATVVIANVTGASGTVGAREAKNSPPDGYTVYAIPHYLPSPYYPGFSDVNSPDFEPICLITSTPSILTASPKTKWTSWQELLNDLKATPGQITAGGPLGLTSHFF